MIQKLIQQLQIKNKLMETPLSYEHAYGELQQISSDIDSESVSVDVLAEKVKRASFLIQYCQDKLKSTEEEVNNIIKQMEQK